MATEQELNVLVRERGRLKAALTRFEKFLTNLNETDNICEVRERKKDFTKLLEQFNDKQSRIELLDDTQNHEDEIESFENRYYKLLSWADETIKKREKSISQGHTPNAILENCDQLQSSVQVKLPMVQLPSFDGKLENWLPFYDSFMSLIHSQPRLSNIQKFHYLKSCLTDNAAKSIECMTVSSENYQVAMDILKARYASTKLIVKTHVTSLFNLPVVVKNSVSSLRQLVDAATAHVKVLTNLKLPTDQWDVLLIHILASKLDYVTNREWEMTLTDDEKFPTFVQFINFLNNRCKLLECLDTDKILNRNSNHVVGLKNANTKMTSNRAYFTTTNKPRCVYCKQAHYVTQCTDFVNLSVDSRLNVCKQNKWCMNCLKENHTSNNCKSFKSCKECKRRHHSLLHRIESNLETDNIKPQPSTSSVINYCSNTQSKGLVMLSTAVIHVLDRNGKAVECRALLDAGSESHFITKSMCDKLGSNLKSTNHTIFGITQDANYVNKLANVTIKSKFNAFTANIDCLVLPRITSNYPQISFNPGSIKIPDNIKLADPDFHVAKPIDLLLGVEVFWQLLSVGQVKSDKGQPYLHKTVLGWVVGGNFPCSQTQNKTACNFTVTCKSEDDLDTSIKKFWEIEEVTNNKLHRLSPQEIACEEHFQRTYKRDETGRFVVKLPFKPNAKPLGRSNELALKRFKQMETKFNRQPSLKENYNTFLKEYLLLGHMQLSSGNTDNCYYLPHHAIIKTESVTTKTRVVFDGSAKCENGVSLNDCLMVGPSIQNDIFSIIIRFRIYKHVFTADIVKMYRQILVDADDRQYQNIYWRENPDESIKTYQLNTVTYGTASAPFLALRCIEQLAYDNMAHYPEACKVILNDFYVDDLLTGADDIEHLKRIRDQIVHILNTAKFVLNKWASNNTQLLPTTHTTPVIINLDKQGDTKTLGLHWNCKSDIIKYYVPNIESRNVVTKRSILSAIAQLYDPLGLVSPAVIIAKIIMQKIWSLKLTWDESLPIELHTKWTQFSKQFPVLNELSIPRMVTSHLDSSVLEVHGFCDASEQAYGACIYIRSVGVKPEDTRVRLLCAKSRVAPLKPLTLPRLELCAALLLARLMHKVKSALNVEMARHHLWSDSSITLAWLSSHASKWKTFIRNRVAEIQQLTNVADWKHISTEHNPADLVSRGTAPITLLNNDLWWHGPKWLCYDSQLWPAKKINFDKLNVPESKTTTLSVINCYHLSLFEKYSTYTKMQRITAYTLRFIRNCRETNKLTGTLSVKELDEATYVIVKHAQQSRYAKEIAELQLGKAVNKKSGLVSLNPFLDSNGILRVGGRLKHAELDYNQRFPMILPKGHNISTSIIRYEHIRLMHGGIQTTLNSLRNRFWPISGRSAVRQVTRNCITCRRTNPIIGTPIMGDLPRHRVQQARPFINSGVDFAGPVLIRESHGRGRRTHKAYISLFICFATKAIHLELVSNLTSEAFLNALKRFISRRGNILNLYSDNATNFVGAKREIDRLECLYTDKNITPEVSNEIVKHGITWHFIPPRSPHFGGIWEAGIKSVKANLKRVIGESTLTYEEMNTLLTRIEACLNSRPLCPISNDPNDLVALTPAHFLIGESLTAPLEPDLQHLKLNALSRWQYIERLRQHFWKRWHQEYVHTLQQRTRWTATKEQQPPHEGALVLLKEDNLPPLQWKLGRILSTHPGSDGVVRVVTIKTASGVVKRAVTRVSVLPIENIK